MRAAATLALLAVIGTPAIAADTATGRFSGIGGSVTVTAAPKGVLVHVEATGLTPGWHAIHFHEKGTCADTGFKLSGAHVHQGAGAPVHGLLNPAAADNGDLPNIYADADGKASAEVFTTLVRLRDGGPGMTLLDADGAALIVHAKADDYTTQPIGGAGDRVGCAVLK